MHPHPIILNQESMDTKLWTSLWRFPPIAYNDFLTPSFTGILGSTNNSISQSTHPPGMTISLPKLICLYIGWSQYQTYLFLCRWLWELPMTCLLLTMLQTVCPRVNTAPRVWGGWPQIPRMTTPCKYSNYGMMQCGALITQSVFSQILTIDTP